MNICRDAQVATLKICSYGALDLSPHEAAIALMELALVLNGRVFSLALYVSEVPHLVYLAVEALCPLTLWCISCLNKDLNCPPDN